MHRANQRKRPVSTMASKGGKARAQKLTASERRAIAQRAAAARWGTPMPGAISKRDLHEVVRPCAELLMRGLAHVGMVALVDEATGTQEARARDALATILEALLVKDLRQWVTTLTADSSRALFKRHGWPFPTVETTKHPRPVRARKTRSEQA